MSGKDFFSTQSKAYAAFRPTYPRELYDFIFKRVKHFDRAWDCATGNGQVARALCQDFREVFATDISSNQLQEAFQANNIFYSVSKAESTKFEDNSFDLITVGQALHWINTQAFYSEVKRVARKEAIIAVWGYSLLSVSPEIDHHFNKFYFETVGKYWDTARKLVETEYASVDFPFYQCQDGKFSIQVKWDLQSFAGYLTSWSATQKFIVENQRSPVPEFISSIQHLWKDNQVKDVRFPVFVKVGNV